MLKADIIQRQVTAPPGGHCDSGHRVEFLFKGRKEEPGEVRFYHVSGKGINNPGIYCEPCVILMNAMAAEKRKGTIPTSKGNFLKVPDIKNIIEDRVKKGKKNK